MAPVCVYKRCWASGARWIWSNYQGALYTSGRVSSYTTTTIAGTYQKGSCIDVAGHQLYNTQQQQRMEKLVRLRWMHRQLRRRSFCIPSAYPVDVVYIINDKNVSIKVKYIFIRIQRYLLNNLLIIYFNTISFYRLLNYVFVFRLLIIKLLFELLYKLHDRNLIECYMTANKYTTVVNLSCVNSSNI